MNRVELAICRIRQKLPGNEGFVTLGSGCIAKCQHLAAKSGWKNPNIIFTSNCVLTKEALASGRCFVVDFITSEKKGLETFDLRLAADTCVQIDSRELGFDSRTNTNGKHSVSNITLTAISAEHLDKRNFLKRMVKRSNLQSSRPIECYSASSPEDLIKDGLLYCVVIMESGPTKHQSAADFQTRTYKFSYNKERKHFMLEEFGAGNCLLNAKDFNREENPNGAVICSKTGEFVGVLDFIGNRMLPLFLPTGSFGEGNIVNNNQETTASKPKETIEGDQKESLEASQQSVLGNSETHSTEECRAQGEGNIVNNNQETTASKPKETIEGDQKQSLEASQQSVLGNSETHSTEECRAQGNIVNNNQGATWSKTMETIEGDQKQNLEASQQSVSGNLETYSTKECRTQGEGNIVNNNQETTASKIETIEGDQKQSFEANQQSASGNSQTHSTEECRAQELLVGISATSEKSLRPPTEEASIFDDHKPNSDKTAGQDSVVLGDGDTENSLEKSDIADEDGLVPEPISHNSANYGERAVEKVIESVEYSNVIGTSKQSNNIIQPDIEESCVPESPTSKEKSDDQTNSKIGEGKIQIKNLENLESIGTAYIEPSSQMQSLNEEPPEVNNMQSASAVCQEKTENTFKDEKEENEEVILKTEELAIPKEIESLDNNSQKMISNLAPETSADLNDTCLSASRSSVDAGTHGEFHLNPSTDGPSTVDSDVQLAVQDLSPNDVLQVDHKPTSVLSFTEPNEGSLDLEYVSSFDEDNTHVKDAPCDQDNGKQTMSMDGAVETKNSYESGEDTEEVSVIKQGATLVTATATTKEQVAQYASSDITEQGNKNEDVYDILAETSQPEGSSAMPDNSGALPHIEACDDILAHDIESTENVKNLSILEISSGSEGHILNGEQNPADAKGPLGDDHTSDTANRKHSNTFSEDGQTLNNEDREYLVEDVKTPDIEGVEHTKHAEGSSEVNPLPDSVDREQTKPTEGPAEDNSMQDTVARENTEQTKIPLTPVELATPKIVVDVVDGAEQERQTEAKTVETSPQETTFSLGTDLGLCVRSLSDMNIVVKRLTTETLLSEAVTRDPVVLEMLGRYLDIEYRYGQVSCWRDVADLLAVPSSLFESCLAYCKSSPTEDLFGFLAAAKPETTMHDVKEVLKRMERVDVVQSIDKHLARCGLNSGIIVGSLMEKEEEYIVGRIAVRLDKPHPQNWRSLSAGLGIPRKVFRNFGALHEHNAALQLLKYLPIFDPELSVAMLKDTLDEIDRSDVVDILDAAGIPDNDPLKDILDDVELMDQVSDLLNEEGLVDGKNWRHLAKEIGVPRDKRKEFEPTEERPSPTKLLFDIIETFDPDITVEELILALVAMKRHDVLEAMKKHFESEDIHKILEENNLLPPMDDSTCSRLEAEGERDWDDAERSDGEPEGDNVED